MKKRGIAILGSTGSIGTQTLEVIENSSERFEIELLTANNNADLLVEQSKRFNPNTVIIASEEKYEYVSEQLSNFPIKVYAGIDAIEQAVTMDSIDIVVTAMVGFAGLKPTIAAIKSGKQIALSNKETLVVAGEIIMKLAVENNAIIIPVDSEHSALFQCLAGENLNPIEKIYLTASGGPFRNKTLDELENVTLEQALKHPNWVMGNKITIDSASMMNKGLESIEAKWLFNLKPEQIEIIVHPQSIIHSIVQFEDGSMKAQMGMPDMRLPIQYAINFPERGTNPFPRFSFLDYPNLSFEKPDFSRFRNLNIAFEAMRKGGNSPCIMNAANEIAVASFLSKKINFLQIPEVIEKTLSQATYIENASLDDYYKSDAESRQIAKKLIS